MLKHPAAMQLSSMVSRTGLVYTSSLVRSIQMECLISVQQSLHGHATVYTLQHKFMQDCTPWSGLAIVAYLFVKSGCK